MDSTEIITADTEHQVSQRGIISILEDIQAKYSYLPQHALKEVAEQTGRSLVDIYGVATFYKAFSLKPRGKHLISACKGTACHVRGAKTIIQEIERQLNIKTGETTEDKEFTFETVNCLGACALGPVIVIDNHYFPEVKPSKIVEILDKAREGLDEVHVETDKRIFPVEVSCSHCNHSLMDSDYIMDSHPSIRVTAYFDHKHGWLILSGLYGSHKVACQYEIPQKKVVHIFCPHCHSELIGGAICLECSTNMVPMIVKGGGIVQICPRKGCKGHILDLGGSTLL
jgi:NADH:ubiquinone oxidoreductase subunit E